jgi:hypothetical protein
MKKRIIWIALLAAAVLLCGSAAGEEVSAMRELFQTTQSTATPSPNAFRFRDGIRWGMNTQQVKALETEKMTERTLQNWSIMLTDGKVAVSRFTADLVFMFREDRLLMISYEFRQTSKDDYPYLTGALGSIYGEKKDADPLKIKALMDTINPNRYRTELITEAYGWETMDGTAVYLYYYSQEAFAIMYVSPELGSRIYQTNGL